MDSLRFEISQQKMENDWLNLEVLKEINKALELKNAPGWVYAMDNNGQGCILFYRDKTWAEDFTKKQESPLVMEYNW